MTSPAAEEKAGGKVLPLRRVTPPVSADGRDHWLALVDARLAEAGADALRTAARADVARLAFPTQKQELWKYTSLQRVAKEAWTLAPAMTVQPDTTVHPERRDAKRLGVEGHPNGTASGRAVPGPSASPLDSEALRASTLGVSAGGGRVVLVNGRLSPALSSLDALPPGVTVMSLAQAMKDGVPAATGAFGTVARSADHVLAALSQALWVDGVLVHLAKGARLDVPLELLHVAVPGSAGPEASFPRLLLVAEDESVGTVVERYVGGDAAHSLVVPVTEVLVGRHARLSRVVLKEEAGLHLGVAEVKQAGDCRFHSAVYTLGGALSRSELSVHFTAPGGECVLEGLYLGDGQNHLDEQTLIDHAVPNCTSQELYKGVLGGKSTAVFHGRVRVLPDAQKTSSAQTNKNLLLSPDAVVNTKPGMEIFADDVKAAHGAAVGQLDAGQLFYLRSRGIGLVQAKQLLTQAFVREVVDRLENEPLRARVDALVEARLGEMAKASVPAGGAP